MYLSITLGVMVSTSSYSLRSGGSTTLNIEWLRTEMCWSTMFLMAMRSLVDPRPHVWTASDLASARGNKMGSALTNDSDSVVGLLRGEIGGVNRISPA